MDETHTQTNVAPALRRALDEARAQVATVTADNERLKRSNAALAEYGHVIAHDVKNPLQAIFGFAELLADGEGGQLNGLGHDCVEAIIRGARRLLGLVNENLRAAEEGVSHPRGPGSSGLGHSVVQATPVPSNG